MTRMRYSAIVTWICLGNIAVGCVSAPVAQTTDAVVGEELEMRLREVDPGSGRIEYSLINHTQDALHVLRWKTPFEGQTERLFAIEQEGRRPMFLGPISHRRTPSPADYFELGPGETKSIELDLRATYDLATGGMFEVSSHVSSEQLVLEGGSIQVHSEPLMVAVDADGSKGMVQVAAQGQALISSECTWGQTIELAQAQTSAADATEAAMFAYNADAHDDRAHYWFGNQPQSSVDAIRTRLANMNAALWHDHITYSCNGWQCAPNSPGHVFEWLPGWMFICPLFWNLPWLEQDWTILHETAHLAGAWGDQYGTAAAHHLAVHDLVGAAGNADNYAFYILDP